MDIPHKLLMNGINNGLKYLNLGLTMKLSDTELVY